VLPPLYVKLAKPKDVNKTKQKKLIEMKPRQELKEGGKETGRHISRSPLTHVFAWLRAKDRETAAW
jgi:hypothetical protein